MSLLLVISVRVSQEQEQTITGDQTQNQAI